MLHFALTLYNVMAARVAISGWGDTWRFGRLVSSWVRFGVSRDLSNIQYHRVHSPKLPLCAQEQTHHQILLLHWLKVIVNNKHRIIQSRCKKLCISGIFVIISWFANWGSWHYFYIANYSIKFMTMITKINFIRFIITYTITKIMHHNKTISQLDSPRELISVIRRSIVLVGNLQDPRGDWQPY